MIKTKIKRIEELNDKYLILNEKEMKFLRKCLKSRKQDVRWTAAEILVGWYTPENERLLYNLTYDKAELVCVDATDSLCIGRTRRSLSRLRDLMEDKRSRVRGYAVLSFFQVWVNCFSWNEKSMRAYLRFAETMEAEEKKTWVRLFYEENKILARGKKGFDRLFYMLEHSNDYYVKASAIQTAKDMRSIFNQEEINAGLEKRLTAWNMNIRKKILKNTSRQKNQSRYCFWIEKTVESHNFLNIWEKKKQKCMSVPQDYILPEKLRSGCWIF